MKLLSEEADFSALRKEYGNMQFHMFRSEGAIPFISCIVCVCESPEDIVENWQAIQSMISVYHQPSGILAAWNVYLIFVTSGRVPVWEKYLIENNKFVARKILLDEFAELASPEQLVIELHKQLLGSDLTLNTRLHDRIPFTHPLKKFVSGAPLDSKNVSKEKRVFMMNEIIEFLSNNEN
ncbi:MULTISPECIES: ABC-three component system middle component 1 [Acinetobacter]|uniref:Uncharacterized protein n=1 Tax=Acinetobacter sedimenti TaxID=2919922 RepID=A0A9X2B9U2_9GAMM|nr:MULTISPECIES: ABC-three component system middle component 1 [Acinetobacter]MCJ8145945.1 hypothetical protein [Acinetobacter sedimenti]MEB6681004.1 hypothetical protein [Acinetobacter lwoffii]